MIYSARDELVVHGSTTSILRMERTEHSGLQLQVIGPDDREAGCLILQPVADGYEIRLQRAGQETRLPFVTWPAEGQRVADILPQYQERLSPRAYAILSQEWVSCLLVEEFKKLLRKAVAHDADPTRPSYKRNQKFTSLYQLGFRMGPKSVAEMARLFLEEEADGVPSTQ
jgi:hypothetical protein